MKCILSCLTKIKHKGITLEGMLFEGTKFGSEKRRKNNYNLSKK